MANRHGLVPLSAALLSIMAPSAAFADTISLAKISISNLSISVDDDFVFYGAGQGAVFTQVGPDNLGNVQQASSAPTADAAIVDATGHAAVTVATGSSATQPAGTTVVSTDTLNTASTINLLGTNGFTESLSKGNVDFQFAAIGHTTGATANATFSMTFYGDVNGTDDAFGSYSSEVMAEFGYYSEASPFPLVPVVAFDMPISGGSSSSQDDTIASRTLTATVPVTIGVDYLFEARAQATSSGADAAVTPEPETSGLVGLSALLLAIANARRVRSRSLRGRA
jgi:hypothetical protein